MSRHMFSLSDGAHVQPVDPLVYNACTTSADRKAVDALMANIRSIIERAAMSDKSCKVNIETDDAVPVMPLSDEAWQEMCKSHAEKEAPIDGMSQEDGMLGSGKWRRIKRGITLDSGSAVFVIPSGWLPQFLAADGPKKGHRYVAANGNYIINEGENTITFTTAEGQKRKFKFKIADVNKLLASVAGICDAGHEVVFRVDGGFIRNISTGEMTRFERRGNVYAMDAWVDSFLDGIDGLDKGDSAESGFTRPSNGE